MKQEDKMSFVDAMEKEIIDHKNGKHWSIVMLNYVRVPRQRTAPDRANIA